MTKLPAYYDRTDIQQNSNFTMVGMNTKMLQNKLIQIW